MAHMGLQFYRNGTCHFVLGSSLEEDLKKESNEGGDGENIIHHLSIVETENIAAITDLLQAAHAMGVGRGDYSQVEVFIAKVFNEGVKYGRKDVLALLLERTKKDDL